jgi:hypothetical protein
VFRKGNRPDPFQVFFLQSGKKGATSQLVNAHDLNLSGFLFFSKQKIKPGRPNEKNKSHALGVK